MVIPRGDEGVARVQLLEIRIALVARVAAAVILQADHFRDGIMHAADRRARPIAARLVFVNVIAEMQDKIEVRPAREMAVGGEEPALEIRT